MRHVMAYGRRYFDGGALMIQSMAFWSIWLALIVLPTSACSRRSMPQTVEAREKDDGAFGAQGRIEGATEAIEVGSAIDGVLESVRVHEGQQVSAGQILARVSCQDLVYSAALADADRRAAEMRLLRLRNGTRREDLDVAHAKAAAAQARAAQAEQYHTRMKRLWEVGSVISDNEFDQSVRDRDTAAAEYAAAAAELARAEAGPLVEELKEAEALASGAKHFSAERRSQLAKCYVKSPVAG